MTESFRKNRKGIVLMLFSSLFVCTGQLMWKMATEKGIVWVLLGYGLYGIGALIMIIAYRFGSLSVLQPMLSLNYVLSMLLDVFILNETITVTKLAGVFIIITGVILIGGGDE